MKLFELIGNTPLIELENIPVNPKVKIYCKLEGQNPGGSVKDRAAYHMIQSALDRGEITKGDKDQDYFMLNQFSNPDNYLAHYHTTGPEIYEATNGEITHFVSAMGTTGTIMGVSRFLKEQNPDIQIVGTQPTEGSSIPGIRRWSPEFLPKIFEPERVDQVIDVSQEQATHMTRRMAKEEGILGGMSSGGALHAAIELSKTLTSGLIVCITCDRGDRYLSSDLFG